MDRNTVARRAARIAGRTTRPAVVVDETVTPDGQPTIRVQKRRRPSRPVADQAAIDASLMGVGV